MNTPRDPMSAADVARLARIELSPEELPGIQHQLNRILEFIGHINDVDLDDVEPFFGSETDDDPRRPDQETPSTERNDVLRNAPDTDGEFYLVPPVFRDPPN